MESAQPSSSGRLVLAATPIGDVDDAPPHLRRLLASADLIAAEDTRRLRRLTTALDIQTTGRVVSYHEHNEAARAEELVTAALNGDTVLVVSDAGMPSVSDPGLRAVRAAIEAEVPVSVLPGPSAVLTALALSGLATDRFCFEGFLPRKDGQRSRVLADLAAERRTMVFFESPRRTAQTVIDMAQAFGGQRLGAVCRELTKTHEQVKRGPLVELGRWASSSEVLGEVTIVVAGADEAPVASLEDLAEQVHQRVASGERTKEAVAAVAAAAGFSRRELYNHVVEAARTRRSDSAAPSS